jgi:TusA-related sulfurtransferase
LRAKVALKEMQVGETLEVLASDPSAKPDFDAMLKHLPHKLISYRPSVEQTPRVDVFLIQKGET